MSINLQQPEFPIYSKVYENSDIDNGWWVIGYKPYFEERNVCKWEYYIGRQDDDKKRPPNSWDVEVIGRSSMFDVDGYNEMSASTICVQIKLVKKYEIMSCNQRDVAYIDKLKTEIKQKQYQLELLVSEQKRQQN